MGTYYDAQGNPIDVFYDKDKQAWVNSANPNVVYKLNKDIFPKSPQSKDKNFILKSLKRFKQGKGKVITLQGGQKATRTLSSTNNIKVSELSKTEINKAISDLKDALNKTSDPEKKAKIQYD